MADVQATLTGAEEIIWDLSVFYAGIDDPAIERDIKMSQELAEAYEKNYRGKVASLSASELAQALHDAEKIYDLVGRLNSFAGLLWNTDTGNADYGKLLQRIRETTSLLQQTMLFFDLEWANVSDEQAKIANDAALKNFRYYLELQRLTRPYLLTEPEEKILEEKSVTGVDAWNRFFGQTITATRFDFEGEKRPLEAVLKSLYMPDRDVRLRAAEALTAGFKTILPTVTYIFNVVLADKASNDKLRKYPSWISSRNLANQTTDAAVDALVEAVTGRYDIVLRYYGIKRKLLNYNELYDYDRYAPITGVESKYTWNEARDIVLNAFGAFNPKMAEVASEFFDKRWIHAPVVAGKRGGAFASPTVPSAHPFVFVNFLGSDRDVATLAHELGHGIHMYLSRPHGIFESGTPLTTAETASVFAEMLVFNDLMARESNPAVRLSMLARKLEDTFATVFRQISMNRFENAIHTARRTEGELATERISELWMQTQQAMFGKSVTLREDYSTWWSYVSHFINVPGYVYAYAFGELLVMALVNQYKAKGASFAPQYLEVLSAGGSDTPQNIMAKAGVDLNDPSFWQQGLATISEMVDQLETLVNETTANGGSF